MTSSNRRWEALLPYPSRETVTELVVAMIEQGSDVALPDGSRDNEPLYLSEHDAGQFPELTNAINGAIIGTEPGGRLMAELQHFERMIAEFAIKDPQMFYYGHSGTYHSMDASCIRPTAIGRHRYAVAVKSSFARFGRSRDAMDNQNPRSHDTPHREEHASPHPRSQTRTVLPARTSGGVCK